MILLSEQDGDKRMPYSKEERSEADGLRESKNPAGFYAV